VFQEAAGGIDLSSGELGQRAVQETQAGKAVTGYAAVGPLNCEPGGIGADC
jgi:hypothetical protein